MKKVFALTRGCYSDYSIVGIFSTAEKAAEYKKAFPNDSYNGYNETEEFVLDPQIQEIRKGYMRFRVELDYATGNVLECKVTNGDEYEVSAGETSLCGRGGLKDQYLVCGVMARDIRHAIKIANEMRIQYKVQNP